MPNTKFLIKALIFLCILSFLVIPLVRADEEITEIRVLADANGALWSSKELTSATGTYYSLGINTKFLKGYTALLIETTDSLTITFEVSADNTNFYTPYDTRGTALNVIATTLSADRWVVFNPQVATYIRFKVVANSNATTTLTLIRR